MAEPTVFISSSVEGLAIARELGRQLRGVADVTVWPEAAFFPGMTPTASLSEAADRSDFAVFVLTADDNATSNAEKRWAPRPNVLFELGFLAGSLGLSRTFLVVADPGDGISLPSDLAGVMYIALSDKGEPSLESVVAPAVHAIRKAMSQAAPRTSKEPEFSSCFLSYSWQDRDFAVSLHEDLQQAGVRCWLDAKDMEAGGEIQEQVDRAIQAHDKVLLVLSQESIRSRWVRFEVQHALRLERDRGKTVLFPLRLDESPLTVSGIPEFEQLRAKYILDFSNWRDQGDYRRAFSRLVKGLAISASAESGRPS